MKKAFELNLFELSLTNFATFQNQTIYFHTHFNSIIGETGSGKSLILDALQLVLGSRADRKLIRKDCEHAVVEAIFTCKCERIKKFLDELGFPFEGEEVVIKRIIYRNGKSKSFLNYQNCSLQTLISFAKQFIDLVGQFENQKLLSSKYQLELLDNYSDHQPLLKEYTKSYDQLLKTKITYEELKVKSANIAQRSDYVNFQIQEIEKLSPKIEEEKQLIAKKKQFQALEYNKKTIDEINFLFEGSDTVQGLLEVLKRLEKNLSQDIFSKEEIDQFHTASDLLKDISFSINTKQNLEFNEEDLNMIIDRLDHYQKLKRKFNVETSELIELYDSYILERDSFSNIEDSLELYEERIAKLQIITKEIAKKIHFSRTKFSNKLEKELTKVIQSLNMKGASIQIALTELEDVNSKGNTSVQFMAETNPGEGFYPIKDIASGGELSRILLAVRNVLSSKDSISIFLFDEIDSGIGGETALTIGQTLAKVASDSQVIAITHLPQIANYSNKLIVVSKELIDENDNKRTISTIKEVEEDKLKAEVSLMNPLS